MISLTHHKNRCARRYGFRPFCSLLFFRWFCTIFSQVVLSTPHFSTMSNQQVEEEEEVIHLQPTVLHDLIGKTPIDSDAAKFANLCEGWQKTLEKLRPVVKQSEDLIPRIFISHAWHESDVERQDPAQLVEARYLDKFCISCFISLRTCGFDVMFDKDQEGRVCIADMTPQGFMNEILAVNVVIAVCTEKYRTRSLFPSGVKTEVDVILKKWDQTSSFGFYLPVMVHGSNPNCNPSKLLVGDERMLSALYIDLRVRERFVSNMWLVLFRICNSIKGLWSSKKRGKFLKSFGQILGKVFHNCLFGMHSMNSFICVVSCVILLLKCINCAIVCHFDGIF